ncbi:saccharopine dehydrogenase family protein [Mycobacterium sp. 4D054]|uniref:saccharopine dehydrogenase family protein n=1 Tax=unclassified Mycobacterium TaxID=2642494 RepID=UPI0021B20A6F|nr:saccharopine dehydrogenase NADP-binding domain-containing protein [Mycobacterium sp. SMC-8]UXA11998.1 saccharopine dehydrogenase NADP-binding domain-containing protein [Mycobacterium sp. SMC-8]
MRAGRDLDIVLFGATGSVGTLTARYLAAAWPDARIGLAGRSEQRLGALREALGAPAADWPLLRTDLTDPARLAQIVVRSGLVVSTVGPYGRLGLPLVQACASTGTDYVDVAGEIPFVRTSIDRCHRAAAGTGARIVHSCGFDSVPSDLTVYALHRQLTADGGGELGDTTCVLRSANYAAGFSRGSVETMLSLMRAGSGDPDMRQLLDDPYSLSPNRSAEPDLGPQPDLSLQRGEELAPELAGLWTSGYLMALYNTRCVRRSNALLNWRYGRRFRYREAASMGCSAAAPVMALMTNATISAAATLGGPYLQMIPPGVLEAMTSRTTVGSRDDTGTGHYRVETYAVTSDGRRYVARMGQRADPGYASTAVLLGEGALALAFERDRLPDRAGVLTPASAMGEVLAARLRAAGVTFDVARLD